MDSLLSQIAGTTDTVRAEAGFLQDRADLQQRDLPLIPLWESQNEIEFNGHIVSNIPTVSNPYGAPAVYIQPDIGWIAPGSSR